jgi:3-oxoacyl-[acyl-carrier-protein] synthase-3
MTEVYLGGFAICFGEERRHYSQLADWDGILKSYGVPALPDLLGMGHFHETRRPLHAMLVDAALVCLRASGLEGGEMDAVYVCSSHFGMDKHEPIAFNRELASRASLSKAFPTGYTLSGCTGFLTAVGHAADFIRAGIYANVLVLGADKVFPGEPRLTNYALFSDSAFGCVLSRKPISRLRYVTGLRLQAAANYGEDPKAAAAFFKRHAETLAGIVDLHSIAGYHCNNIFPPIFKFKETASGIPESRLFLRNIEAFGHSFGADPLFNLHTSLEGAAGLSGGRYVCTSDAPPMLKTTLVLDAE